eukprot:6898412-Heterocapsa_arctica.AAC.1
MRAPPEILVSMNSFSSTTARPAASNRLQASNLTQIKDSVAKITAPTVSILRRRKNGVGSKDRQKQRLY